MSTADCSQEEMYNSRHPLVRYAHNKRAGEIVKMVKRLKPKRILEVGCGEGFLLEKISRCCDAELHGVDTNGGKLWQASAKGFPCKFYVRNATKMPFDGNSFDLVIASEVIEHIEDYRKALSEIRRVAKKHIIISFPNELVLTLGRLFTLRFPAKYPHHKHSFTPRKFNREFGQPVEEKTIPALPFPLALNYIGVYEK